MFKNVVKCFIIIFLIFSANFLFAGTTLTCEQSEAEDSGSYLEFTWDQEEEYFLLYSLDGTFTVCDYELAPAGSDYSHNCTIELSNGDEFELNLNFISLNSIKIKIKELSQNGSLYECRD